jgi:hypothetical protein
MALPSSGQISFNDVRVEVSQSAKVPYEMSGWTFGKGSAFNFCGGYINGITYAPINVLSSGSRFSQSNPLIRSNLSMSAWYNYDHTPYIELNTTGTLYQHADPLLQCYPTTMLVLEAGTTNVTLSINISGSPTTNEYLLVTYGKPWTNTGTGISGATAVYSNYYESVLYITASFFYNYTYNSDSGSKLYFVLLGACS